MALAATGKHNRVLHHIDSFRSEDLNDWGDQPNCVEGQSKSRGVLLEKLYNSELESGFWECTAGSWTLEIPRDEFCHFIAGEATYIGDDGSRIDVKAGSCVHFEAGWKGTCHIKSTLRNVYMLTDRTTELQRELTMSAKIMYNPLEINDVVDWGTIPTMIEGESKVSGVVLHKGPNGESETGLWICTPGKWHCHVTSDEFCHFMEGRATYVHESGEVTEIYPNTAAFFPKDWKGTCTVHEQIKKTYMIR